MSASQAPSLAKQIGYNLALMLICIAVLYPALWVLKMALTPSQAFSLDASPFPTTISFDNFWMVISGDDPKTEEFQGKLDVHSPVLELDCDSILHLGGRFGILLYCRLWDVSFHLPWQRIVDESFPNYTDVPRVVMAIPLYILMDSLGLLNSSFGLALVYSSTAVPFCTWNLKGYFDTIPQDLEDAARIDGASQWVIFTQIVLPLSKPALAVTALFSFMTAWNEFILLRPLFR